MKKKLTALLLSGGLLLTACSGGDGSAGANKDGNMAVVNGIEISNETYYQQLDMYANLLAVQAQLPQSIENSLITEAAMLSDLEANGIEVTEEDYQEEYDKVVESQGGEEGYQAYLEEMNISDEQMKDSLRYETVYRIHHDWYLENNAPSDEDIQKYYEDNKDSLMTVESSHILVETEEEANEVLDRLNNGEDFAEVAKEVSLDSGSAANGGSLGEANPNAYVPEFKDALLALEEGEVSEPVQSQFGFHIIKLESKNDDFESQKDTIAEQLTQGSYSAYIQELVTNAEIQRPDEEENVEVEEVSEQASSEESTETSSEEE